MTQVSTGNYWKKDHLSEPPNCNTLYIILNNSQNQERISVWIMVNPVVLWDWGRAESYLQIYKMPHAK
jgi:abortive infection bacteriophage resistance protein